MSSLYVVVWRLLELILLFARSDRAKEVQILLLRHELSILRRQVGLWGAQTRSRGEAIFVDESAEAIAALDASRG